MRAWWLLLALLVTRGAWAAPPVLVLSAPPPLDGPALAEVLRTYLDGYVVELEPAGAEPQSLRAQLDEARSVGERRRAVAVVRLSAGGDRVEVQLVDRLGDKALVASIARAPRAEDLYRTVALKVEALLRSALFEEAASPAVQSEPALARMVPAPSPSRNAARGRVALEAGWTLAAFPQSARAAQVVQGAAAAVVVRLVGPLALSLAAAALTDGSATEGDVTVAERAVPAWLAARLGLERGRVSLHAELDAGVLVVSVAAASATTAVAPPTTFVDGALGLGGGIAVRIVGPLSLRAGVRALAILGDEQPRVRGDAILGLGHVAVTAEAGLALALP